VTTTIQIYFCCHIHTSYFIIYFNEFIVTCMCRSTINENPVQIVPQSIEMAQFCATCITNLRWGTSLTLLQIFQWYDTMSSGTCWMLPLGHFFRQLEGKIPFSLNFENNRVIFIDSSKYCLGYSISSEAHAENVIQVWDFCVCFTDKYFCPFLLFWSPKNGCWVVWGLRSLNATFPCWSCLSYFKVCG
jgi:hypothetical protein